MMHPTGIELKATTPVFKAFLAFIFGVNMVYLG